MDDYPKQPSKVVTTAGLILAGTAVLSMAYLWLLGVYVMARAVFW